MKHYRENSASLVRLSRELDSAVKTLALAHTELGAIAKKLRHEKDERSVVLLALLEKMRTEEEKITVDLLDQRGDLKNLSKLLLELHG
jgi:hypothetical protein